MMSFEEFREQQDLDIQSAEPELLALWQSQYEAEQERSRPAPLLVVPIDCSYPQRGHWIPVGH